MVVVCGAAGCVFVAGWLAGWLAGAGKSAAGLYRQVSRAPDRCVQHPVQPRETAMSPDTGGEGAFRQLCGAPGCGAPGCGAPGINSIRSSRRFDLDRSVVQSHSEEFSSRQAFQGALCVPQDGFTSLMIAAQHGDNDMLQTLIKHGASVNAMPRTAA